MRRPVQLAAVVLAAASAVQPAYADDAQKGIKVGTQFSGVIASTASMSTSQSGGAARAGYEALAACGYVAAVTPNNRMTIEFTGKATGAGPSVPMLTWVRCEVASSTGESAWSQLACGGNACYTASVQGPWKVGEVSVCVSAEVLFASAAQPLAIERTCDSVF